MEDEIKKNQFKKYKKKNPSQYRLTRLTRDLGYKIEIISYDEKRQNHETKDPKT
jgi:hypothetical protein